MTADLWNFISNPHNIIEFGGLFLVLTIIYLETGFFLGFILPGGDYMLFAAGIFCGSYYLDIPLFLLVLLLITASYLGDLTGYFKGKWLGNKFFTSNNSRFFKKDYLVKGSHFYQRYGVWAFIFGRFMPVIRTLVPMIAGASSYPIRKFLLFDALGAVFWVGTLVPLGYYIGKTYPGVMKYSVLILILFIVISSFPLFRIMFGKIKKK